MSDENGFVVSAKPEAWTAIFGYYTPSLRTTELIPEQVRLLRSLLVGREAQVERIVLATGDRRDVHAAVATPSASPKPKPSKAP